MAELYLPPEAQALLDAISGPESKGKYDVRYGGATFDDFSDHPRQGKTISSGPNQGQSSTAAGRYQITRTTWDNVIQPALNLPDFSPESQDIAAWYLAQQDYKQNGGGDLLEDLKSGDPAVLGDVAEKLSGTWTSLPGGIEANTNTSKFVSAFDTALQARQVSPEVPARRPDTATAAIDEALGIGAPADALGYAATTANTIAKPTAAQLQAMRDPQQLLRARGPSDPAETLRNQVATGSYDPVVDTAATAETLRNRIAAGSYDPVVTKPSVAQLQAIRDPMAAAAPKLNQQLLSRYAENYVPTKDRIPQTVRPGVPGALPGEEPAGVTVKGYGNDGVDDELLSHLKYIFGENLETAPSMDWKGRERSTNVGVLPPPEVMPPYASDYTGKSLGSGNPTMEEYEALTAAQNEFNGWLNNGGSLPSDSTPEEIAAQQTAYQKRSMEAGTPLKLTGGSEDDPAAIVEAALGTTPTTPDAARVAVDNITSQKPTDWGRLYESLGINPPPELTPAPKTAELTFDDSPTDWDTFYQDLGLTPPTEDATVQQAALPPVPSTPTADPVVDPLEEARRIAFFRNPPPIAPREAAPVAKEAWSPSTSGRALTGDEPLVPIAPDDALDLERLTAAPDGLPLSTIPPLPKATTWADLFKMREPAQVAPIPATRSAQVAPIPATRAIPPMPRKPPVDITVNGGAPQIPPMPMPRPASRMPGLLQSFKPPTAPREQTEIERMLGQNTGSQGILDRINARRQKSAATTSSSSNASSSGAYYDPDEGLTEIQKMLGY